MKKASLPLSKNFKVGEIDKRIYGKVVSVRGFVHWSRGKKYYSDDWHGSSEKEGGGVTVNQAVHTLDLIRYLTGSKTAAVTAHTFNDHLKGAIEVEDTVHALFEYENGVTALFNGTTAFAENLPVMIDIICKRATLRIEGENAYIIMLGKMKKLRLKNKQSLIGKSYWGSGHPALIKDFYAHAEKGLAFPIDAYEGGKATEEFLAIYKSSQTDEKVKLK